ncbi:hypothetical protein [Brevibacillus reuszeri]|uniref:hypothetical protein n=2 Tax=Paenibacillaceae TaxID=186822 RepID=UPI000CCC37C1|nr:hypothetical protein [Brevibacillus reuszeri]
MPDQDEVIQQLQSLSAEFARLSAANVADETRLKLLEETQKRHDDEIREIKISTGAMKEHYMQILGRFDSLETKLFTLLQQTQTDGAKERTANQRAWISLIKYVLGGTIIALITYVFTKGGV